MQDVLQHAHLDTHPSGQEVASVGESGMARRRAQPVLIRISLADTPSSLRLTGSLYRHDVGMTSNNAGIRRNRLPAGVSPWETKVRFSPELKPTLVAAARASGNLSPSLYLEQLLAQLADESGNLPVLNLQLDEPSEVTRPTAA